MRLLLALLLWSGMVYGQSSYVPFDFEKGRWGVLKVVEFKQTHTPLVQYRYHHQYTQGDTLIDGHRYHLLYQDTTLMGGIRADNNRRIWYYNMGYVPTHNDCIATVYPTDTAVLLYDFSLSVGDTIPWRFSHCQDLHAFGQPSILKVTGRDSIQLLNGVWRQALVVEIQSVASAARRMTYVQYWVEGIGALNEESYGRLQGCQANWATSTLSSYTLGGLLYSKVLGPNSMFDNNVSFGISCYYENTTALLGYHQTAACEHPGWVHQLAAEKQPIKIAHNPFSHPTTFLLSQSHTTLQLELYDLTGRLLHQQIGSGSSLTLTKNHWPAGLYVYRLYAEERLLGVGKVAVE